MSSGFVRPIPFVEYTDSGKFLLGEEAKQMLAAVKTRIAVVSVAGMYRTGKSYILNQLAGKQSGRGGFQTGSTVQACTKGLWIWGEPIQATASDGKPISLILLDTEGIASLERSEEANVQIFSLALLFSSFFIYNSMMTIDESAIDRLSLVAEVTKRIRRFADDKRQESPTELAEFFPQLLWLLRDFALELRDRDGRPMTPKDYLEQALRPQPGDSARVVERNNIRMTLQQVFPQRDCFTMVRPTHSEKELQEMSQLAPNQLRPEFLQELDDLQRHVFTSLKPKMISGQALNGAMLCQLAIQYVDAINHGAVPTIMSAWENVASVQNHEALEESRNYYVNGLRRAVDAGVGPEEFEAAHRKLWGDAMANFDNKGMGMYKDDFAKRLQEAMTKEFNHLKAMVEKNVGENCTKILDQLWFRMSNVQYSSSEEFSAALKALFNDYNDKAPRCLAKMDVLMRFLSGNFSDVISKYVKTHEDAAKGALAKQKKLKEEFQAYEASLREASDAANLTENEIVALLRDAKSVRERLLSNMRNTSR